MAPNWCENELDVVAPDEAQLRAFLEAVKGQHGPLDFNRVVPMPKSLEVEAGSRGEMAYAAWHGRDETGGVTLFFRNELTPSYWLAMPWMRGRMDKAGIELGENEPLTREHLQRFILATDPSAKPLGDQYAENIRLYGTPNWYDWCHDHWGTKWNVDVKDRVELNTSGVTATLAFETAWSPPLPVMRAMAAAFPQLRFHLHYWEGGAAFHGELQMHGEEVLKQYEGDYSGPRGG